MVDRVTIYRAPTTVVDADEIADWLRERLAATADGESDALDDESDTSVAGSGVPEVTVRDRFLAEHRTEELPERFAETRVLSPYERETGNTMLGTVRYEERALDDPARTGGVLYDGLQVQRVLNGAVPAGESGLAHAHVVLLDRALGTWGDHDGRWHKRVTVLGQPGIVSVPGLYEAPAKPEAYYEAKQRHALLSGDTPPREVLENRVEGDFLVEDDPRTTDALKGYVLQAVHYLATGEAFCSEEGCKLYNAHHHEEVIEAQLRAPSFCGTHAGQYGRN